jgi:thiamine biosynthesis protein ThiI
MLRHHTGTTNRLVAPDAATPRAESVQCRHIIVHYDEIALKGRNRSKFERGLRGNIKQALRGLNYDQVQKLRGRLIVKLRPTADLPAILDRLSRVCGVNSFAPAWTCERNLDVVAQAILKRLPRTEGSFAVRTRRADKSYALKSAEINAYIGEIVRRETGMGVDLSRPDITIHIEWIWDRAVFHFGRHPGPGGLPVGTSGRVVALLSGGIDSPVAAARMMQRGCRVDFVHCHSAPVTSQESIEKVKELAERLTAWQNESRLYLVPIIDLQKTIVMETPPSLRILLYRRFMLRLAEAIAQRNRARALITGESVGQVASQTLENLTAVEAAVDMLLLRPLIGHDKRQITQEAERLGTYGISIQPHDDCCSYLLPRRVETRARADRLDQAEAALDIPALMRETLKRTEVWECRMSGAEWVGPQPLAPRD